MPYIVTGADKETGELLTLTLVGPTQRDAEDEANKRGLLISNIRYVTRHNVRRRKFLRVPLRMVFILIVGFAVGFFAGREYLRYQLRSSLDLEPSHIATGLAGIANKLAGASLSHRQQDVELAAVPVSQWNQMMLSDVIEMEADQIPALNPRLKPIGREPRAGEELLVSCDTYFAVGDRYSGAERLAKVLDLLRAKDGVGLLHMVALTRAFSFSSGEPVLVIAVKDGVVEFRSDYHRKTGRIATRDTFTLYGVSAQFADGPD